MSGSAGAAARGHAGTGLLARALALALPLCLGFPVAAFGQLVGNEPEHSPYRDILTHQGLTLFAGRFAGNANAAGTGVRPGLMVGGRLQVRVSAAFDIWASFGEVMTSRLRIDAGGTVNDTAKVLGNMDVKLLGIDLGLGINLTGDKTWHGFAPYVGLGFGIMAPTTKVVDPGGFELGTDFAVVPTLGTRFFISRNLALRFEARDYYFRYTFPLAFFDRSFAGHKDFSPVLPQSAGDREWYQNYTFSFGLTYGFDF